MTRINLINHLTDEGCYKDEEYESAIDELWHNCINGQVCLIPFAEELEVTTYCHILYELKVDPPVEYDSFYHVYVGFREKQLIKIIGPG